MTERRQAKTTTEAYWTLDPFASVEPGDPWFVDLDAMLPREHYGVARKLERLLVGPGRPEFVRIGVVGQYGVGKSTLLRGALGQRVFQSIYVNSLEAFDQGGFTFSDLALVTAEAVLRHLDESTIASKQLRVAQGWFTDELLTETHRAQLLDGLSTPAALPAIVTKIVAALKTDNHYRREIRQRAAQILDDFVHHINLLLDLAHTRLGKKPCVLLDELDKFAPEMLATVLRQSEGIRQLRADMVFVLDPAIEYLSLAREAMNWVQVPVLPTRLIGDGPSVVRSEALAAIERLLAPRVDLDAVFADPRACMKALAQWSGGHIGDLLWLARRAAELVEPDKITLAHIEEAGRSLGRRRVTTMRPEDLASAVEVHLHKRVVAERDWPMIENLCVLEHTGSWWDVHPAVRSDEMFVAALAAVSSPATRSAANVREAPKRALGALNRIVPSHVIDALHRIEFRAIGPADELELELSPRVNLILGDNGLGKTFLLDVAWWALTGSWPGRAAWPDAEERKAMPRIRLVDADEHASESRFDLRLETWPRDESWPRPAGPVVYARIDGGVSIWDPLRNDLYGLGEPQSIAAYHLSPRQLEIGLEDRDGTSRCNGLFSDWESWKHDEPQLFERFFAVVRGLFAPDGAAVDSPNPGPSVQLSKHDETRIPTLEFSYGRVPLIHLSAGMKRILGLAYALVWAWHGHQRAAKSENGQPARSMILLIDEVESHLHPRWQRLLLPALLRIIGELAGEVSVQVLATTHSPLVLASLVPTFDEQRDKLSHLDIHGREVLLRDLPWANFGDASGWLTSTIFGLGQASSLEAERAIKAARAIMRGEEQLPDGLDSAQAIDAALQLTVAPEHPIWDHWKIFMRNQAP
ncbi:MAG: ATP-binding protein [Deltaproteobacteria bacterium]|nr:ATP-binding protein [Deltaproteobacteria bacterium]